MSWLPSRSRRSNSICPSVHLNGTGFLHFARFHELVDQAEAAWFGLAAAPCVTTRRRLRCEGRGFLETLFRKGRLIDHTPVQPAPSAAAIASAVSASAPS